ncbi:MAG TPA: MarR family transcriptional regulator [Burkholderiaceae bacterium]|jgi:DNA-binding MarR family transcriptional regulator
MTMSLRTPRHLDDLLNYRLLRLYALSGAPVLRLLEGRYGISRREWRLLSILAVRGELSPSVLAEQTHLDRPRATRGLQALVAKRLASRVVEANDTRRARVTLTGAGRRLYDEIFPQVAQINAAVVQALDDAGVRALDTALSLLTAEAEKVNGELVREFKADRRTGSSGKRGRWGVDER